MNDEELIHSIGKGLEAWTLQNMADIAILLTFVALAMAAGRIYLDEIRNRLTLRVAAEVWDVMTDFGADVLLFIVALVGLFVVNPDIMADIKIGLPWVPLGFILTTIALVVRVCHGGREVGTRPWWFATLLLAAGCALCWFGFTFVMEAAGEEFLKLHPSATWTALRHMRSDMNPELAMTTFLWAHPVLLFVFGWAGVVGMARSARLAKQRKPNAVSRRSPENE
jgi:hypothetical protein